MANEPAPQISPAAAYDIMHEAATLLISAHYSRAKSHPVDSETMDAMRAVRAEVLAIGAQDISAQLKAIESFEQRREQILQEPTPEPGDPGFQSWLNSLACSTEDCPNDPEPGEEQCYGCLTGA